MVLLARCSLEDHRPGETPHLPAEAAGEYFQAAMAGPNTQDTAEVFYLFFFTMTSVVHEPKLCFFDDALRH